MIKKNKSELFSIKQRFKFNSMINRRRGMDYKTCFFNDEEICKRQYRPLTSKAVFILRPTDLQGFHLINDPVNFPAPLYPLFSPRFLSFQQFQNYRIILMYVLDVSKTATSFRNSEKLYRNASTVNSLWTREFFNWDRK